MTATYTCMLALACGWLALLRPTGSATSAPVLKKPNIVFILTDDQSIAMDPAGLPLGDMQPMKRTRELLVDGGLHMENWFVNTPVCCPSRSEYLSGRYAHNIRDSHFENSFDCDDYNLSNPITCGCMRMNSTIDSFETAHYGNLLQRAGYTTAYFGKYLNPPAMEPYCRDGGTPSHPVNSGEFKRLPGWDHQLTMCNTEYFNVTWNLNGSELYTGEAPHEYSTSIIGNYTVNFLHDVANGLGDGKPFHVVAGVRAPHNPMTPAPWYENSLPGLRAPRSPAYNLSATGHVPFIAVEPRLSSVAEESDLSDEHRLDKQFNDRWRTLLSVDDLVSAVVDTLDKTGLSENTYLFYSSDHGYHLGLFRIGEGKQHHYDFDIRVPMFVRGPGITGGTHASNVGGNVDLAPTFLDLAGVPIPPQVDGRSIAPLLRGELEPDQLGKDTVTGWRTSFLVEHYALADWPKGYTPGVTRINDCPANTYRALRVIDAAHGKNLLYVEMTMVQDWWFEDINFYELYDLDTDPYQITNIYNASSTSLKSALAAELHQFWHCAGSTCP